MNPSYERKQENIENNNNKIPLKTTGQITLQISGWESGGDRDPFSYARVSNKGPLKDCAGNTASLIKKHVQRLEIFFPIAWKGFTWKLVYTRISKQLELQGRAGSNPGQPHLLVGVPIHCTGGWLDDL